MLSEAGMSQGGFRIGRNVENNLPPEEFAERGKRCRRSLVAGCFYLMKW